MQFLAKFYQRITWLSLDVVLGAMAGMLFFARLLRVSVYWEAYVLLGLAVWCIYTADHLLDSRKLPFGLSEDRHKFHRNHFKALLISMVIVGLIGLYGAISFFGISRELFLGAGLGILILGIMLLIRKFVAKNVWLKELSSAVFYVVGVSWLPWYQVKPIEYSWNAVTMTLVYMGLAYLNLMMLSNLDSEKDREYGFKSISTMLSPGQHLRIINQLAILLLLVSALALIFFPSLERIFPAILLLMVFVHYQSFFNSNLNAAQKRMRMEAAFMIPGLLLLF
ncbi:hypothetical protein AAGF08_14160 [Algoriphagus sp. SE2]|uniref:hypothetical protein n=1 Tax=Algoriphagus sp. SE2 TaxID=3141536 RepID=UPI0031CDAA34